MRTRSTADLTPITLYRILYIYRSLGDLETPLYTVGKQCLSLRNINHAGHEQNIDRTVVPTEKLRISSEPTNGSDFAYF